MVGNRDLSPLVQRAIQNRLKEHTIWPENILKLELEGSIGVYQDYTGRVIDDIVDDGTAREATIQGHKYLIKPGKSSPGSDHEIVKETERFYQTLKDNKNTQFSELAVYVALSKVYTELSRIPIDVHSRGNYPRKFRGMMKELDAFVELYQERFPIEVYNGRRYVSQNDDKIEQVSKRGSEENPTSNPVLVNRLSSEDAKKELYKQNGTIIDTGAIVTCTDHNTDLQETLQTLHISNQVHRLPPFETQDGLKLDGEEYHSLAKGFSDCGKIAPTKVAPAADTLPESYLRRIRGGVHLMYVNTFYRRASGQTERDGALLLQSMFHKLLRNPGISDTTRLVDLGWKDFRQRYPKIKADHRESTIKSEAKDYLQTLRDENIVIYRNGDLYARASDHPHISLSFEI